MPHDTHRSWKTEALSGDCHREAENAASQAMIAIGSATLLSPTRDTLINVKFEILAGKSEIADI